MNGSLSTEYAIRDDTHNPYECINGFASAAAPLPKAAQALCPSCHLGSLLRNQHLSMSVLSHLQWHKKFNKIRASLSLS